MSTRAGRGTTFVLRLPLTLAVSEALSVVVGDRPFALPASSVRETRHVPAEAVEAGPGGREVVTIGGERLPFLRLDRALGLDAADASAVLPAVVVQSGGRRACLAVTELLGLQEVVIQGLGGFLSGLDFLSGASITPEGRVVLLLDPGALAAGAISPAADAHGALEPAESIEKVRRRLLLVDDSLSVRRHLGGRLENAGFEVVTAADGEEALDRLRVETFDAMVTDLEMPRLNGYELIENTRRRPETQALPIAVITTRAGDKHLALARQVGAGECFTKPIDERALVAYLQAQTAGSRPLAGTREAAVAAGGSE